MSNNINSLKKQVENIVEIIIAPFPEYKLIHNYKKYYCDAIGDDFDTCDDDCKACKCSTCCTYDFAILSDFDEKYIVFDDKFTDSDCYIIQTEDDVYKMLDIINKNMINRYKRIQEIEIEPYLKIEQYTKYAEKFFYEVVNHFKLLVNTEILPIRFYQEYYKPNEECEDLCEDLVLGELRQLEKVQQYIINIYHCNGENRDYIDDLDENIYSTIKHEVLHYILFVAYLKNNDDNASFHALCKLYDAGAYEKLDDNEQLLYDNFMYINDNATALINKYNLTDKYTEIKNERDLIHFMLRFIGSKEFGTNEEFLKFVKPIYDEIIKEFKLNIN